MHFQWRKLVAILWCCYFTTTLKLNQTEGLKGSIFIDCWSLASSFGLRISLHVIMILDPSPLSIAVMYSMYFQMDMPVDCCDLYIKTLTLLV